MTISAGRVAHLTRQADAMARHGWPDLWVVVSMGDPEVLLAALHHCPAGRLRTAVIPVPPGGELPLAAARNAGAGAALSAGVGLLCFLDVDCLPGPGMLRRYRDAVARLSPEAPGSGRMPRPVVLSGPVVYLPPAGPDGYDLGRLDRMGEPHPARPAPPPGHLLRAADLRLFWSLSFAMTATDWALTGGFFEGYTGYGGEDTDFGQVVQQAGGSLWWVGGATAYHQHHAVSSPPVEHLAAVLRNANLFRQRWGWFPMEGWLSAFAERGLARPALDGLSWTASGGAPADVP